MRAILTYHSIDGSGSPISIDVAGFRRHVEWLASGVVRVLPLEAVLEPDDGDERDAVAITFDDGLQSVEDFALPLLREHGLPATVFVVSDQAGRSNAWGGTADRRVPELPLMDWDALGRLAHAGFALGAHSRTHPHLTRLSDAGVEDEMVASRDAVSVRTGARVTTFAYPYGDVDERVRDIAARHFALACGTELRLLGPSDDAVRLPRLDAYYLRARGQLEAWGTPRFRLLLDVRRGARRIRHRLENSR